MRRTKEIKIEEGRDAGKVFVITEMPALQMDKWATRALNAIGKNQSGGVLALLALGVPELINSFLQADYDKIEPLMQEMLQCCSFKKDGTTVVLNEDFVNEIVEDWNTITNLRIEAIKLNLGFFNEGDGSGTELKQTTP